MASREQTQRSAHELIVHRRAALTKSSRKEEGRSPIGNRPSDKAPGDDLLLHGLGHTTIGAYAFHFRVRDGIGWFHTAIITRERVEGRRFRWIETAHTLSLGCFRRIMARRRRISWDVAKFTSFKKRGECRRRIVESKAT